MKNFGKVAQLFLLFVILSFPVVGQQEAVRVVTQSNLRSEPNTSSLILDTLNVGEVVTVIEAVTGESVTMYGRTSDVWFRVMSGQTEGYLWSLLVENQTSTTSTAVNPNYPDPICANCGYDSLTILSMQWVGRGVYIDDVLNIDEVIDVLYSINGRDIWIGYDNGGFGMPSDARIRHRLIFQVAQNVLHGPLLYDGALYDQLVIDNDEIQVWFLYSETSLEYYVFPFISMTRTCTPSGEHCGEHLTGAYAIQEVDMTRILSVVEN